MSVEVATSPLNFSEIKKKAIASRSIRTLTFPSNGQSFTCGQTINFETQANSPGMYIDTGMSYLKFKISNSNASDVVLDQTAYSVINRMLITSAGSVFADIQRYNLLHNALTSLSAGREYSGNNGRVLAGGADLVEDAELYRGATISATTGEITVALPLALNPLVNTTPYRYIYLGGRAPFQFKLTLEDAQTAFKCENLGLANSDITISDFEFVAHHIQLNENAQSQVSQMVGGKYNVLATEFVNFQTTLANGVSTLSFPLGLARSSVDRLLVIHRPQSTNSSAGCFSLSNRAKADMSNIRVMISGQSYPQRRIDTNDATVLAEYMIANHNLDDMAQSSQLFYKAGTNNFGLDNGAGNASNTVGSYIVGINLDSLPHNTISQSVFLEVNYDTVPANMVVDVFAQSTILLSMDENAGAVYQVSV